MKATIMHFFQGKDNNRLRPELPILMLLLGATMLPMQCAGQDETPKRYCHKCKDEAECAAMEKPGTTTTEDPTITTHCSTPYCLEVTFRGIVTKRSCAVKANFYDAKCILEFAHGCFVTMDGATVSRVRACMDDGKAEGRSKGGERSLGRQKNGGPDDSQAISCYCNADYCNRNISLPQRGGGSGGDADDAGSITALDKLSFLALLVGVMLSGGSGL